MERLGRSRGYVYTEVKALQDAGVRAEERALHLGQSLEQSRAKRGPLNQGASFQCWIDPGQVNNSQKWEERKVNLRLGDMNVDILLLNIFQIR